MKKTTIFFILSILAFCLFAHTDTTKTEEKHQFTLGFGFGPETGFAIMLPKISYYNFQDRKIFSTYYGIETTIGMIHTPQFALNCLYGIKRNIFTLDASVGAWWLPKRTYKDTGKTIGPYFHSTINPKFGIKFWKVWLKVGPSIHLYKNYRPKGQEPAGIVNLGKVGNNYYNFEILITN
jgi:hypothetical protein